MSNDEKILFIFSFIVAIQGTAETTGKEIEGLIDSGKLKVRF